MVATQSPPTLQLPPDLNSKEFTNNKYEYYKWLREEAPVFHGKISVLDTYIISRYDDCVSFLKDPRFVRNRTTATGGGRMPFPMPLPIPRAVQLMAQSMITEDEPDHRRLRNLVHQAFTRHSLEKMSVRIDELTHDLLDKAEQKGIVDLKEAYALPIPVTVIQEMMGVDDEDMPKFKDGLSALKDGFSGWTMLRTMFWDMPRLAKFVRELIERKRSSPQNDILTKLIQAEDEGKKLNEDELVAMVFLMIIAGYETTVQLITNGVLALLQHPEQLEKLKSQPELIDSAVEEILRYLGPVQSTKPAYALEDVTLHGVTIPKGATVMPFLGAANHDPAAFENPDVFDIERFPNKHLGFGSGIHSCLGAPLARMETKIAIANLIERNPNLRLATDPSQLKLQIRPGWHTYESLPVVLKVDQP